MALAERSNSKRELSELAKFNSISILKLPLAAQVLYRSGTALVLAPPTPLFLAPWSHSDGSCRIAPTARQQYVRDF